VDGGIDVRFRLANTGSVDADEVPQVYLGAPAAPPPGVQFPRRSLVAFGRVHVPAGESRTITLHVAPRRLQYWSVASAGWVTASGSRMLSVGASSRDLRLQGCIHCERQ
jgi:beta-glucosidase